MSREDARKGILRLWWGRQQLWEGRFFSARHLTGEIKCQDDGREDEHLDKFWDASKVGSSLREKHPTVEIDRHIHRLAMNG